METIEYVVMRQLEREAERKSDYKKKKIRALERTYLVTIQEVIPVEEKKRKKTKKGSKKSLARKHAREMKADVLSCEICGTREGKHEVHHIDRDVFNNSIENLIKICIRCHIEQHEGEPVVRIMRKKLGRIV